MRLRVFNILIISLLVSTPLLAQYKVTGQLTDESGVGIPAAQVHDRTEKLTVLTDDDGNFELNVSQKGTHEIIAFGYEFQTQQRTIEVNGNTSVKFTLARLSTDLAEITVTESREEIFNLKRLEMVEGTSIYAGKKSEVVLMDNLVGNLAANNARQIYSQVVGLNIYESGDAGLQLSVGGRGLDPNRTANFNTRQNGYDISADVLGYPESYYTPPAEALEQIQVVRGAASLQYGTQFGGLINFKMKRPSAKNIEWVSRQSAGSFGMLSTFNSLSGTVKKFSYYTYFHHKRGDGFRPNSQYNSNNVFTNFNFYLSDKTSLSWDFTHLNYLAQQPGGLTDTQFNQNANFSNRERNWFEVDWNLANLKVEHKFSSMTEVSLSIFGLSAQRNAIGFRGDPSDLNSNPVSAEDVMEDGEYIYARDLIKGKFRNYGAEFKFLTRYDLAGKSSVLLLGSKYYKSSNTSEQGAGTFGTGANFSFDRNNTDYPNQSSFQFPNTNLAFFGEHIFFATDKLSITPGFRVELIETGSDGTYNQVIFDNAGNPISNHEFEDNRTLDRAFVLFGLGTSYHANDQLELYGNFSQNYRSVTFNDIRTVSPTFIIDPSISDEDGYTADLGARGQLSDLMTFDVGGFGLLYNNRIGIILDDRANRVRKNIGKAFIYGLEIFGDLNLLKTFGADQGDRKLNLFVNTALTDSEYIQSEESNVVGKKVEFIPNVNFKTGLNFGYKSFSGSLQWTYVSRQYTDVENSRIPDETDNRNGVIGEIPTYQVMDASFAYSWNRLRFETGVNNLLNSSYFTRRATGYPGPGIIPSEPRNFYFTLQMTL